MAIRVDILAPIVSTSNTTEPGLMSSTVGSELPYSVLGYSAIIAQIDTPYAAALTGTITLQCSQNGVYWYNFPPGAITYTSNGVQAAVNVEGLAFVKFRVTATTGTVDVVLTVSGVANV